MNDRSVFAQNREVIAVAQLRGLTFALKGAVLRQLLELRRFNPNQPRVPRGHRYGGRWVADGKTMARSFSGSVANCRNCLKSVRRAAGKGIELRV